VSDEFWDAIEGRIDEVGFQRHPTTGAPFVEHPKELTKVGKPKRVMYGRPSSAFAQIDNLYNLQKWAERMTLIGAVELFLNGELLPDELDIVQHYDPEDSDHRSLVDGLVARAKQRAGAMLAAERGTQRHLLTEHHDEDRDIVATIEAGVDLGIDPAVSLAVVECWRKIIEHFGIEITHVEQAVVDDENRLAGTLDRVGRLTRDITLPTEGGFVTIPAGTTLVVDLKTGALKLDRHGRPQHWLGYSLQVASYSIGRLYLFDPERRGRWSRRPSHEHAVIVHIDATEERVEGRLIYVNIDAGREGLRLVRKAKEFAKRRDAIGLAGEPHVVVEVTP
jgi:hypothetical protein